MVPYVVKIWINTSLAGFSEVYYSDAASFPEAKNQANQLVFYRRGLLALNASIVAGSVTYAGVPPNGINLRGFPLAGGIFGGAAAPGSNTNVAKDAIHLSIRNDVSTVCNRLLRGVPDDWIRSEAFGSIGFDTAEYEAGVGTPDLANGMIAGQTPLYYLERYAHVLFSYFGSVNVTRRAARKGTQRVGRPTDWAFHEYKTLQPVRPTARAVGRPFGPFRGRQRSACKTGSKISG